MARLFHISDLHFGREDRAALDWFAGRVRDEAPDAVIATGDLTTRARRREFAAAADYLDSLDVPVTLSIGNHDLPYFNLAERFLRPYRRFETIQRMLERPLDLPCVTIVPLRTTSRFQWRLNWSKGVVDSDDLATALQRVEAADPEHVVLVTCHHPLIETGTLMAGRTRGGPAALDALARAGADAILSGHVHDPFAVEHRTEHGPIHLVGAGTLSERVRESRPSFNELAVQEGRLIVSAHVMQTA